VNAEIGRTHPALDAGFFIGRDIGSKPMRAPPSAEAFHEGIARWLVRKTADRAMHGTRLFDN